MAKNSKQIRSELISAWGWKPTSKARRHPQTERQRKTARAYDAALEEDFCEICEMELIPYVNDVDECSMCGCQGCHACLCIGDDCYPYLCEDCA